MHKLETLREAAEMIEDKIVQMCFETDPQVFVQWLRVMVGNATIEDDVVIYETLDGRRGGFDFRCDPSTKSVMIAIAIGGMIWTHIFPGLMGKVNKTWKRKKLTGRG
ncbi:MAG TPA: hypothetical protein VFM18_19785 [Methanosarcina sp.]|nr:hypothetical protein [Methanosarcina sp.]